jgi:hypothetical protein
MPTTTSPLPVQPLIPGGYSVLDPARCRPPPSARRARGRRARRRQGRQAQHGAEDHQPRRAEGQLRSGAGYDTARAAFLGGASRSCSCARHADAELAALAGATGTPVTLTSIDYGSWTRRSSARSRPTTSSRSATPTPTASPGTSLRAPRRSSATAQQLVDAINGKNPASPASKYVTAAVTTGTMPLTTAAQAALTTAGTDDSSIDAGDWTTGLRSSRPRTSTWSPRRPATRPSTRRSSRTATP